MIKKLFAIALVCAFMFCLASCSEGITEVNVSNNNENFVAEIGFGSLTNIGGGLWYDHTTGVVYWWNGSYSGQGAISPTPYYSSNGLPYRYDSQTNTLEEITPE